MPKGLNKAPDGEYWNFSWNPVVGCSQKAFGEHPCPVAELEACFAWKIYDQRFDFGFTPGWVEGSGEWDFKMDEPLTKSPCIIFMCLMGEFWDEVYKKPSVNTAYLIKKCEEYPWIQFLIATKQPQNIPKKLVFPDNLWLGVSICNQWMLDALIELSKERGGRLFQGGHFWISFEPLYEEIKITDEDMEVLRTAGLEWLTIGGQTRPALYPERAWVNVLGDMAKTLKIPFWVKRNSLNFRTKMEDGLPYVYGNQQLPPALAEIRREI